MPTKKDFPKIVIVILNYNGKQDTLQCLQSLQSVNYPNFETILVDNGSKDDSVQEISKHFPDLFLIETFANLGYAGGNNVGIDHGLAKGADFILLLNNDTVVNPEFLNAFVKASKQKEQGGIFGGKILRKSDPNILDHVGGMWDSETCNFKPFGYNKPHSSFNELTSLDYVCGCALLIKRSVFEKVGKLDPKYFLLWEETDFCTKARKKGFEIWAVPDALIHHKVSASFEGKAQMQYYWWRNRLLWMKQNLAAKEYKKLVRKVLLKEMIKIHKLKILKSAQFRLLQMLAPQKINAEKKEKLKRYQAGCKGISDFYKNRLGKGL